MYYVVTKRGPTSQKILKRRRKSLENVAPPQRTESRIPKRMLLRLCNAKSGEFEITPTIDISYHGAQVVSRRFWKLNEQLLVKSTRGNLYSRARVAHYLSLTYNFYSVGLHLYHPNKDWTTASNFQKSPENDKASLQNQSVNPNEVLKELCTLLQEYSPTWYTENRHKRALAAERLPTRVLLELVSLLEAYAPSWYTKEQRDKAWEALRVLGLVE